MRFLGKRVVFAGAAIFGLLACSSSNSVSGFVSNGGGELGPVSPGVASSSSCTEDGGVLTPIGPQGGCGVNQTLVYRKPIAASVGGSSAIASGAGTNTTPQPAMVAACTNTKCGPGQVAVVTYESTGPSGLSSDDAGLDSAATAFGDSAAPAADSGPVLGGDAGFVVDSDAGMAPDGASVVADGGVVVALDGEAPDSSPPATADASDDASESAGDGGVIGIPCGAVVTCINPPPTCPTGQSPSYAPSGKWHCMPLCDGTSTNTVVITYGSTYGNVSICAGAPPATACPTQGDVWTWDYQDEEWVCAAECDNGQYDQHVYNGQMVCVPC